jgi:glycosyltransferase involved in cell wall biosynthesis
MIESGQNPAPTSPADALPEIFFVIGTFDRGGAETHLAMIARRLVQRGWKVSVYALAGHGPLRQEFDSSGATILSPPVTHSGSSSIIGRLRRIATVAGHLLRSLAGHRPAIAHFFLPMAYIGAAPIALLARVPIRIMSRRSLNLYQRDRWWLAPAERALHRTMTAILGNSRSVVRELEEQEGVPRRKLGLIYNGIDAGRFLDGSSPRAIRAGLGIAPAALVLVIIANLIPYKGHRDLIEALGRVRTQLPDGWCLLVVGRDDGIASQLQAQAREAGIGGNVAFLGPRTDVPDILRAADIGLLCSHQEGFSNAILEGMAAGLPMIVTDVGGNAEAVRDNQTGLVVPPRDPARLSAAILRLANDAALRTAFGAVGRSRVGALFSLDHCIDCYEELYRTLLAGRPPSAAPQVRVTD